MEIPEFIKQLIQQRINNNQVIDSCDSCNSNCCAGPGFALLENVLEIYKIYQKENLKREDYEFQHGLSLYDFIFKYFNRVLFNNSLLVFFPKTLDENFNLVSVPPWNFYQARDYIQNRIKKRGCIFLSKSLEQEGDSGNYCILHNDYIYDRITEKPIDCTFLICGPDKKVIKPTNRESAIWFPILDYYFPESKERFNQICPNMPD